LKAVVRNVAGLDPGTITQKGPNKGKEAGEYFEQLAYGGRAYLFSSWPSDYLDRAEEARKYLGVDNVLLTPFRDVKERPIPRRTK